MVSVSDLQIIDEQGGVHGWRKNSSERVNLQCKESDTKDTALGHTRFLGADSRVSVSDTHSEEAFTEKFPDKYRETPPKAGLVKIAENAIAPRGVVGLFEVEEDRHHVVVTGEGLSDECLQSDEMIDSRALLPKAALNRGYKFVHFKVFEKAPVNHAFHALSQTTGEGNGTVINILRVILTRF